MFHVADIYHLLFWRSGSLWSGKFKLLSQASRPCTLSFLCLFLVVVVVLHARVWQQRAVLYASFCTQQLYCCTYLTIKLLLLLSPKKFGKECAIVSYNNYIRTNLRNNFFFLFLYIRNLSSVISRHDGFSVIASKVFNLY